MQCQPRREETSCWERTPGGWRAVWETSHTGSQSGIICYPDPIPIPDLPDPSEGDDNDEKDDDNDS